MDTIDLAYVERGLHEELVAYIADQQDYYADEGVHVALRYGLAHCGRFSVEYRRRYGETPSQTLKRQAVFFGALTSMPSLLVSRGDRPTIALGPIDASPENSDLARSIADELATALTRAGVSVTNQPGSARNITSTKCA